MGPPLHSFLSGVAAAGGSFRRVSRRTPGRRPREHGRRGGLTSPLRVAHGEEPKVRSLSRATPSRGKGVSRVEALAAARRPGSGRRAVEWTSAPVGDGRADVGNSEIERAWTARRCGSITRGAEVQRRRGSRGTCRVGSGEGFTTAAATGSTRDPREPSGERPHRLSGPSHVVLQARKVGEEIGGRDLGLTVVVRAAPVRVRSRGRVGRGDEERDAPPGAPAG